MKLIHAKCAMAVFAAAVLRPLGAAALDTPFDNMGFGWSLTRLDLDVYLPAEPVRPAQEGGQTHTREPAKDVVLRVEGRAELVLEAEASAGPTVAMNAREKALRFTRVTGPASARVEINKDFFLYPVATMADVRLDKQFRRGDSLEITFAYESTRNSSQLHVSPAIAVASWTEAWHPMPIERPDRASLSRLARSVGTTRIHMPKEWRSVSDGRFVGREENEDGAVETWQVAKPVARSFAAGPFHVERHPFGEREVGVYLLDPKPTGAAEQAKALAEAISAMEKRFGPFPYSSYGIVEVPDGVFSWYAASQQGFILAQSKAFAPEGGNLPLFAHEAAHAWWGNLVNTGGPGGILCSESLAQYGAVIAIEALEGEMAAVEFLKFSRAGYNLRQCAKGYFQLAAEGKDKPLAQLQGGGWEHDLSDAKGHWVFHMLRRRIGDDMFFATLRRLIREYEGRAMSLDDLRRTFLEAAPDEARLADFFEQWLERTGAPVLEIDWRPLGGAKQVEVTLRQRHSGEPYDLDVELEIETEAHDASHVVRLYQAEQRFPLACEGVATAVRLDPKHRLLMWKPEYGPLPNSITNPEVAGLTGEADAYFEERNWSSAAKSYAKLSRLAPEDGRVWFRLGYAYHHLADFDAAAESYRKAAAFPEYSPSAHYNAACAYALKRDKDKAFAALESAVKAGFDNWPTMRNDADLELLRSDPRFVRLLAKDAQSIGDSDKP